MRTQKISDVLTIIQTSPEPISSTNIAVKYFSMHAEHISGQEIREAVNYLRKTSISPVCSNNRGYYVSNDKQQIKDQVNKLQGRIDAMNAALLGLQKFIN